MKSSRKRFAEFREKLRKGKLDPERFADLASVEGAAAFYGSRAIDSDAAIFLALNSTGFSLWILVIASTKRTG